jgi:4-amino-4-deoxy-L-arabinose transferase-like glycosyltransferase
VLNVILLINVLIFCYLALQWLELKKPTDKLLAAFVLFSALVVGIGYCLSALNLLDSLSGWALASFIALIAIFLLTLSKRRTHLVSAWKLSIEGFSTQYIRAKKWYLEEVTPFEKWILLPLFSALFLLSLLNLTLIFFSAPHNWDSMTYHLARMAYILQHKSLDFYEANFWAQVVHPKNGTVLLIFSYLISGKNENLTQIVQFFAYHAAVISVYGICRLTGLRKSESLFAAGVAALLPSWLMQATTTQNDMLITAFLAISVYFLLSYRKQASATSLALSALGIGLALGTKASAVLPLASIGLVALYALYQTKNHSRIIITYVLLVAYTIVAILLFALPAGYAQNYQAFGHPLGPEAVRSSHTFEGRSADYVFRSGTRNLLRFGFDFLSLDGLPPIAPVAKIQSAIRGLPEKALRMFSIDLENREGVIDRFTYQKLPESNENSSNWGIFGFGLIWLGIFLAFFGVTSAPEIRVLALSVVVFMLVQAYAGPYDPWRGRYFTLCAVLAVPAIGPFLRNKHRLARAYLFLIVVLGSISGIAAVLFRDNGAFVSARFDGLQTKSIFELDRFAQMTISRPDYAHPAREFDAFVPQDATVALALKGNSFEYPLFGEKLTRSLLPINLFDRGLQPVPDEAEYLLYSPKFFPCELSGDVHLGSDWYLRKLEETNRYCP